MENIVFLAALCATLYQVSRLKEKNKDGLLTGNDKLIVILTEIFNPIISGAIYYFTLKKKLPITANHANRLSFIIFGIEIACAIILGIFSGLV